MNRNPGMKPKRTKFRMNSSTVESTNHQALANPSPSFQERRFRDETDDQVRPGPVPSAGAFKKIRS